MKRGNRKVIVIGLDGATFDIIDPMIREGRLPHLASLIKNGTRAPLKSTIMPNSYPAWTSCVTGVNPGKHGIFWSLIRDKDKAYPLRLMNARDIQVHTVWQILGKQGYRVGIVNIPTEYPPTEVNGFLVCGALTPSPESEYTYPRELKGEILRLIPEYKCEIDYAQTNLNVLADQIMGSIRNREKLALYLLENKPWDLFFMVFTESDLTQHKFWAGMDAVHPDHPKYKGKFGHFINDVYQRLDASLGEILKKISEDTIVFVISDHGFGPFYQSFSLNRWLTQKRYLQLEESWYKTLIKKFLFLIRMQKRAQQIKKGMNAFLPFRRRGLDVRAQRDKDVLSGEELMKRINWSRTKAYFTADYGIRLNLEDREPEGIIRVGEEKEALLDEIKSDLRKLRFSNGQPVFEAVLSKEEAFSGPLVDRAPDLIVPINYSQSPANPEKWEFTLTHSTLCGTHSKWGVFIAKGKGIKKGFELEKAELVDITPTLLYIFKLSPGGEMDGDVLHELFELDFLDGEENNGT